MQQTKLLAALSCLFSQAKIFYQHTAETVGPGNLRRQFSALAELHQHILYLFPPADSSAAEANALSGLSCWYNTPPNPLSVSAIQQQLATQLQLQKALIRSGDLPQHHKSLLHFTASLQIAADQLAQSEALPAKYETFTEQPAKITNIKLTPDEP
ncbi:MAG: hypothetical protein KJ556_06685 [Gammaproteobacteria bacterium]|nr:hypothetical protein [Gammaproteobacteria bacterium]MBU2059035.1 hypothetical protein [Gammaproteobacteria bacterium]MBU2174797.1 hypothetical protein [Gammaproteobacteria bacterium]MBU2245756.1 hypothetical protein [Gammaproteobacteria bacterium]MBU2343237.1 hypothetical protein [Gammaproteobacteria bacterium]